MTNYLKSQIRKRQFALAQGNQTLLKYYRNLVIRHPKQCREKYYHSKIKHLKNSKPKNLWIGVRRICGHSPISDHNDISSLLVVANIDLQYLLINNTFLESQQTYEPIGESDKIHQQSISSPSTILQVTEFDTFKKLKSLNSNKSPVLTV